MAQLEIQEINQWDQRFFKVFISLSQRIYRNNPYYLKESIQDYQKRFTSDAPFARHNDWIALLAFEDGICQGRLIVNVRKDPKERGKFAAVGFFEAENLPHIAKALFARAESWSRERGIQELRTPVSGHFFISYRIQKGPYQREPFYGEPLYPDYYHDLFAGSGFSPCGQWDTYRIQVAAQFGKSKEQIQKLQALRPQSLGLVVRPPDLNNWERELKLFYHLLLESYQQMTEYWPISWEEFKTEYWNFKYILDPKYTFFVEFREKTVGFVVGYRDPLDILLRAQRSIWPWRKLLALWRLRHNKNVLLVPYVGKALGATEVKGLMATLTKPVFTDYALERSHFFGCYVHQNSPSFGGSQLLPQNKSGTFVLYQKLI